MNREDQLVIGTGEIGQAMLSILGCYGYDKADAGEPLKTFKVLHICFPFSEEFVASVREYVFLFNADLVIVHSTVPLGTCDPEGWVHSPVRGVHPDLELGIRTFVKFFGGARAHDAAAIFREKGIKTYTTPDAKDTEALKLWDTTIYGWNILIEKAIRNYCDVHGLDFALVYTLANATYNEGYALLGKPQFSKYVLKDFPGPIGGHCILPNLELLEDPIARIMKDLHSKLSTL